MVKIALAGASGNVAHEVLDGLVARNKHEIVLLSRKPIPPSPSSLSPNVTSIIADYTNVDHLTAALQGVDTVLCFIVSANDPGSASQKALIDAAVRAGVRRYAPSEWASATFDHMPWYANKASIRHYLTALNTPHPKLECCIFQAGLFVNYFVAPHYTSKYVHPFEMQWDFANRRAIVIDDDEGRESGEEGGVVSLVTVADFVDVVVRAVEYEGVWPEVGGMVGDKVSVARLIEIGQQIRGPFKIDRLQESDLTEGVVKSSWLPVVDSPSIPEEERKRIAPLLVAGMLRAFKAGAFDVGDEWNRIFSDKTFTTAEEFLVEAWKGRE